MISHFNNSIHNTSLQFKGVESYDILILKSKWGQFHVNLKEK